MLSVLLGFILGGVTVILIQYFTLSWIFKLSPKYKPPRPPAYTPTSLPPDLSQRANGPFREETCQWVNFCGAFLFQELRESNLVKKAVITKLNEEFKEFLLKKTTGQLLHQVTVRDYFLGESLPQVNSVQVFKVRRDEKEELLTEVTVGFDLDYKGAALIAIDADIVLGKSLSVSVELLRLQGKVRLQFSREPYTHWSVAFMREPLVEIRVAPEFQGRNVSQLTTLIEKVIHRFIRKKHTLPYYKVRRSPIFPKLLAQSSDVQLYMHDTALTEGILEVDIMECSRLLEIPEAKRAFCTAAITDKPWKPLNRLVSPANGPMLNLTVEKNSSNEHGISFQRYQDQEMELNCIVVSEVIASSPAYNAGVMKGDFVFFINAVDVKTVSKAKSLIETSSGSFILTVQRFFSSHIHATGPIPVIQQDSTGSKQVSEFEPEIASLIGGYTPEPPVWEEKDRQTSFISEKGDIQVEKEPLSRG
ncbi:PDZ domain-containing protein 8-like [Oopsacas minuta]|uniref:PDZ domain-containing protein 8-like n=1 Tax=Oopsacas minuta TaxID=111878 RepID=A0AAV7KHG8_9METZ|nr:PDZ domain-containing protein 8-like [Oopsacas minuta]